MKKFIILSLLALSTLASAQTNSIELDSTNADWFDYYRPHFTINADLGRAWIEVGMENIINDEGSTDELRIKVDGLSFDQESQNIIFEKDDIITICAKTYLKRRRFSTSRVIKRTGLCQFKEKFKYVQYDNGYEIRNVRKIVLTMEVN